MLTFYQPISLGRVDGGVVELDPELGFHLLPEGRHELTAVVTGALTS